MTTAEWDELCDRLGASPALRPGWFSIWWDAFGQGTPEVLTVRRGGRLAGVLPMAQKRNCLASPTNWHTPEFGPVAIDRDAETSLIEDLFDRAEGRIDLGFLREEESTPGRLSRIAESRGYRTISRTVERSPYVRLDGEWEGFESHMTSKRRSDLRRRRRRLEETGSFSFECFDGSERLEDLLAEGIKVEELCYEERDGTPIAAAPHTRRFYEQIARWAAQRGELRLFFLRIDQKPIAFAFCLCDERSLYVLKNGFTPSHSRFAPGMLLTREMLKYAFDAGLDTYEFLGNAETYKMVWADEGRNLMRFQAFPRTFSGLVGYSAWRYGRPAVQRARRL